MKSIDDGLKQRLIGAVVLLALAVIFIPVLFDRDKIEPIDQTTQLPPPPTIDPQPIAEPQPEKLDARAPPPETMFVPDESQAQNLAPEPPSPDVDGSPRSWVLQVASFKSRERAVGLRQRLSEQGYPAFTREVSLEANSLLRVYIGPKVDKAQLVDIKRQVDKQFEVDSLVLEFKPAPQ